MTPLAIAVVALVPVGLVVGVIAEGVATNRSFHAIRRDPGRTALVAIVAAGLFAATPAVIGVDWTLPAYLWFVGVTLTLMLTDIDTKLIPNRILFPGTVIGLVLLVAGGLVESGPIVRALVGGAIYFLLLMVLALIARGGFGFGDVKLSFLLGLFAAYQSWDTLIVAIFAAFLLGGIVSLFLVLTKIRGRKDAIPFGPYLVVGAYLAIAWGGTIASWYLGGAA
jgi:leader peptidase (prepilin peptidase)/N-methyltransferase